MYRRLRRGWQDGSAFDKRGKSYSYSLSNLPTYFLSLFPFFVGVANWSVKLFQSFLWGDLGEAAKFHLVYRERVCTPLLMEIWGFIICMFSTRLVGSGCVGIIWKRSFYGGR